MTKQKEEEKSKLPLILIVIGIAIVTVFAVILLARNKKTNEQGVAGERTEVQETVDRDFVTEENASTVTQSMQEKVADGYFECIMTNDWTFPSGAEASVDAYVANSESNHYTICFDLTDNATGELLYASPLIPVGSELSSITLDKNLEAGEYEATAMYSLVNDDKQVVSQAGFIVRITVQN